MDRRTELELIDELLDLKAKGSPFLDEAVTRNPVEHYTSAAHFQHEREAIFAKLPSLAAHVSELAKPGDFVRREVGGRPILITRDKEGEIRAFLNVCRHRGTRLVEAETGCKHRFSCPYHAWTYANSGELIAAPHFDSGFPDQDKQSLGLQPVGCAVRFGFIWVAPTIKAQMEIDAYFEDVAADLDALKIEDMAIEAAHWETRHANWKILAEGGIESYHFKVAHRTTIGPYFEDNLSSYRPLGQHMRSVLPRVSMAALSPETRDSWRLRDHANVLYMLFPNASLLVQQDHIVLICQEAVSADETRLRLVTLAPRDNAAGESYWAKNHQITSMTLAEDFAIGESMQSTLRSGANDAMVFGRFEGALNIFNRTIAQHLDASGQA